MQGAGTGRGPRRQAGKVGGARRPLAPTREENRARGEGGQIPVHAEVHADLRRHMGNANKSPQKAIELSHSILRIQAKGTLFYPWKSGDSSLF